MHGEGTLTLVIYNNQPPNNSAVATDAPQTRVLHSLHHFLDSRGSQRDRWILLCTPGRTAWHTGLLLKSDADLRPSFSDGTTTFFCPCFSHFCLFSARSGPQRRQSGLFCNTGLSRPLTAQGAGDKAWKMMSLMHSTRSRAGSATWGTTTPHSTTGWGQRSWKVAWQNGTLGCWSTAG